MARFHSIGRWLLAAVFLVAGSALFCGPAAAGPRSVDFERVLPGGDADSHAADFERVLQDGGDSGSRAAARQRVGVPLLAAAGPVRLDGGGRVLDLRSRIGFDLVGFRWRGRGSPRIVISSLGVRGWSRWTPVGTDSEDRPDSAGPLNGERASETGSEPVWTGRSVRLRVRVSGHGFYGLRAHFVKVAGLAGGVNTGARAAGTGGVGPVDSSPPKTTGGSGSGGSGAGAGAGTGGGNGDGPVGRRADVPAAPPIVTRAQWGGDSGCKPRATPVLGEVLVALVHHTVSTNSYSAAEAPSVVLGICRYHRNSNKWNDIGYNLVIDRFGTIYEGRSGGVDKAVVGAHAQGYNGQTTGIALAGTFTGAAPPAATMESLQNVLKWKLALAGITRNERVALISTGGSLNRFRYGRTVFMRPISGHRDVGATSCPGNGMYSLLPGLAGFLDQTSRIATRMTMTQRKVAAGGDTQAVRVAGRLRGGGQAVAGEPIEIQSFTVNGWVKIAEARTDAGGYWQTDVQPRSRAYVRGAFAGNGSHRPVRSNWMLTPKIKLPPASGTTGSKRPASVIGPAGT